VDSTEEIQRLNLLDRLVVDLLQILRRVVQPEALVGPGLLVLAQVEWQEITAL
jgi:hypothetical protein